MILQTGQHQDVTNHQNMHHRIPITNINSHLICSLCKGYFVDATTIIECLHSFCRSCIVKYLEANRYCPVCDVQVHKTKPLLNIRPDKTLQDIVYKLVPRLFQNEMQRRRQYYSEHPDLKPSSLEQCGEASYQHLLTPDESICISFNYHGNSSTTRYLRCPAAVSVTHLKKLIRAKYDLKDNHRIDILYNQDYLNSYLTLMDIAYIYLWRRKGPMEITYRIYENTNVKVQNSVDVDNAGGVINNNNNSINHNDWKEVQLRISENGEMSVTGIQDCLDMLDEHIEAIDESSRLSSEAKDGSADEKEKEGVTKAAEVTKCSTNEPSGNKRKLEVAEVASETGEPPTKKLKPSGLQNLSNNHPLKKYSLNKVEGNKNSKVNSDIKKDVTSTVVVTTTTTLTTTTSDINKKDVKEEKKITPVTSSCEVNLKVVAVSVACSTTTTVTSSTFTKPSTLNTTRHAVLNNRPGTPIATTTTPPGQKWGKASTPGPPSYIPKAAYSPIINVPKVQPSTSSVKLPPEINTTTSSMMSKTNSTVVAPKSKPNSPMGYKTLRDPPKTWNPQISRPKPSGVESNSVRPAKFFKMRNNIPRYLGNPASGVKPLYQVHHNVEKEKPKPEIKRHSIVKIDPKTLKPVSERAPEASNLTNNQTNDLKINTSSVPIFNPLKLQNSPKSADRKSPQSPKKSPPANKRDKLSLNYTPPNPYIPNLGSPTMNPQFLYHSGPPGFPSYDPRYMAAYHTLLFGSRLPASYNPSTALPHQPPPHPPGGLNLEMKSSTSPRANSPKSASTLMKPKKTKEEKSLQNAVEKLTKIKSEETKAAESKKEEKAIEPPKKVVQSNEVEKSKVEIKQKAESNVDNNNQNNNTIAAVDNGVKGDNNEK